MKLTPASPQGDRALRGALWAPAALVAALVADLAETIVDPANTSDAARFYAAAVQDHDRMVASALLLVASSFFIATEVVGLSRRLQSRGRRLGIVASVLAILAAAGHVALAAFYLVFTAVPGGGLGRGSAVALIDHVLHAPEVNVLAALAIAFPLAILAVFFAVIRARLVSLWTVVPVLAAPVVALAGPGSDPLKTSVALVLFLASAAALVARTHGRPGTVSPAPAPVVA